MESPLVTVTGANGLVGAHVCAALVDRGARVRAVVRREGAAPDLPGLEEVVGDVAEPDVAAAVVEGADALVTTVHPMGSGEDAQRATVEATLALAGRAADAGVARHVHLSTAAVYDRRPGVGDVDESSPLVDDDAGTYPVTKRDLDLALADPGRFDGLTRVLVRPPAVLGPGASSTWNTLRPAEVRDDPAARRRPADASFAWVHVDDLAALVADLASGRLDAPTGCTAVNVAGEPATQRDYLATVAAAVGVAPVWVDAPAWTGRILADRARSWGWTPSVSLADALDELRAGLAP